MTDLRFDNSVWCNIDIALRRLTPFYEQEIESLGLSLTEWYLLRTLYEQDGQHPSQLAQAVGRAATSFTPILDGLESKELIERRPEPKDRRAIRIYLTEQGTALKNRVEVSAKRIETQLRQQHTKDDWRGYQQVLAYLQTMTVSSD